MTTARTAMKRTAEYSVFKFHGSKRETRDFNVFLFYTFWITHAEYAIHLRSGKIIRAYPAIQKGNEDGRKAYVQFKSKKVTRVYTLTEDSVIATLPVEVSNFEL